MTAEFRPRVRPHLAAGRDPDQPDTFVLHDPRRLSQHFVRLTELELVLVQTFFDGRSTAGEMQSVLEQSELAVPLTEITGLIQRLDDALLLDSPKFHDSVTGPIRQPACIGSYSADPGELRQQLSDLFTAPGGPGLPDRPPGTGQPVRAVLLPHMDYARGGVTYGHGARALYDGTAASLFVIVATSHYSPARFTLTRQHFATPLGVVPTDSAYVDRLAAAYGDGLFDDPFAHLPEHSVELEVLLLQYLFGRHEPIRIVPLLVGSFHDCVQLGRSPGEMPDIARMVAALRSAEATAGEPVVYVISGDLAHIGPKFDDPDSLTEPMLADSRRADRAILDRLAAADADGYFRRIAAEGDRRRICGLPPTWLTLAAVKPRRGRVSHYQQFAEPRGYESVSFAAAAFAD